MWVFAVTGFYSIIVDRHNPDHLLVRSRVAGDIEALWPSAKVEQTPTRDYTYTYRASIPRHIVMQAISSEIEDIDYDNYRHAIHDLRRLFDYTIIWQQLARMGQVLT
jgi:hypothetical protein